MVNLCLMPHWKPSKTVKVKFRFQYCLQYRLFLVIALTILFYRCFILSPPWIKIIQRQQSAPNMYENGTNDSYAFIHQFIPSLNCLSNQFQWNNTSWYWVRAGCTPATAEQKQNTVSGQNWKKPTQVMWPVFFFWWLQKKRKFKAHCLLFFFLTYSLTVIQWIQIKFENYRHWGGYVPAH